MRAAELDIRGIIFYKSLQLLAYANDFDIKGLNIRHVISAFSRLVKNAKVNDELV